MSNKTCTYITGNEAQTKQRRTDLKYVNDIPLHIRSLSIALSEKIAMNQKKMQASIVVKFHDFIEESTTRIDENDHEASKESDYTTCSVFGFTNQRY